MREIAKGPAGLRNELFRETARKMRVHEAIIEKDFWVCCVLDALFSSPLWADKLLFKGGTSLSKVFHAIDRFSEDIDLILDWRTLGYSVDDPWKPESNTRKDKFVIQTQVRTLEYLKQTLVPHLAIELPAFLGINMSVELDMDKVAVNIGYPRAFDNPAIVPNIILEIGPLASWTPHGKYSISPYAAEHFPKAFSAPTCAVKAVTAVRTFWEKATILHQEAHRPETKPMPNRYSRHYYDMYRLAKLEFHESAIQQVSMLREVVEFKQRFYRAPWARLEEAASGALRLVPPEYRIASLEEDYSLLKKMIFNPNPPQFAEVVMTLSALEKDINS